MTIWLLVMAVHFNITAQSMTLDIPSQTVFLSYDRCMTAGKYIADSLMQDGVKSVTWHCTEIQQ